MTALAGAPAGGGVVAPPLTTRVVIVDDTADFRLLLRTAIEGYESFEVVGEAGDGRSGLDLVARLQPDVVLLDLAMPVMDGLEALPRMKAAAPRSRVIVLSGFESSRMATIALSAGASAYLQKGAAPDRIVTAIAEVRGGQAPAARTVVGTAAGGGASEIDQLRAALATAAHELRSPATILAGLSQTLRTRRERLDAGTVDQLLDAIVRQATVLDRLTADLLTTSQLHRGTVSVDPRPVLLAPVLAAIAIAVAEREQISVDCAPDVSVLADQVRVEQMVNNLLANAFKYGAPPVSIEVRTDGTDAVVSVTDRGPGVPSAFLPQLFGQYARADGVRASGTGIGLYVVSSLAQAQGGRAWYDPTPDGLARFRFSLPLVPDAVPTGSAG